MRKAEIIFGEDVLHPRTKASVVLHENRTLEDLLKEENQTTSSITQTASIGSTGLGDNVDLSFCVQDGFYESATLYGKTMVNCIQEPSSKDVVLPYAFEDGQYVTINDTKESGALGVELKGQTLVNHLSNLKRLSNCTKIENGFSFNVVDNETKAMYYCQALKPNTKYTFFLISNFAFQIQIGYDSFKNTGWHYVSLQKGLNRFTLTTENTVIGAGEFQNNQGVCLRTGSPNEVISITHLMIIEGDHVDKDIPYFTGMTSCKMPTLKSVGKNLFNCTNVEDINNSYTVVNMNNKNYITTDTLVEKGKQYTLSLHANISGNTGNILSLGYMNYSNIVGGVEKAGHNIITIDSVVDKTTSITFTAQTTDYIKIYIATGKVGYNVVLSNVQIEESSNTTSYEAHKSSILSLPEEVVLRILPNGVCDTFNTRTGVYTQRIGEVVLDGENYKNFSRDSELENDTTCKYFISNFFSQYLDGKGGQNEKVVLNCNYLPPVSFNHIQDKTLSTYPCIANSGAGSLNLRVGKDINSNSLLLAYLQSNPITIQYELATPIVTKINLSSTLKSWNTTTHIYSEIPENTLYPILSHSNLTYPVILKPSTKYSIVANSYSNGHTNSPINFNLGGATASTTVGNRATTITTPSTLSNELLTMSGRGNKLSHVMVIEGDVVGDEPYFEGICDCKSPILLNIGKNLFNVNDLIKKHNNPSSIEITKTSTGFNMKSKHTGAWHATNYSMQLKPNTQYIFNCVANTKSNTGSIKLWNDCESFHVYRDAFLQNTANLEINITFTTQKDGILKFQLNTTRDISALGDVEVSNVSLYELTNQTTYEPYKSNVSSCTDGIIKLTEDMFEQGTTAQYSTNAGKTYQWMKENSTHSYDVRRLRLKELIKIQPNTKLILQNTDNFMYAIAGYDSNKLCLGTFDTGWVQNTILTIPQNVHYISCVIRKKDDTNITINDFKYTKFTISEVNKTIVLRSLPNGVCDTLNVITGEYVQRIGEVVFDGSVDEEWTFHALEPSGKYCYKTRYTVDVSVSDSEGHCDKLIYVNGREAPWNKKLNCVSILNTKWLTTYTEHETLDSYKQWLSQNPLTVQYELAEPVASTVSINGFPYAYANGCVQLSSGVEGYSLTPKLEYTVQTSRTGAVQANQDRLLNHEKRLSVLESMMLKQLVQLEYSRAKCIFFSQTRQIFEGGIQMHHTKYELLLEFIDKKLYRSFDEILEMLDVYFMLGDLTEGEYNALYSVLFPVSETKIDEVEEEYDSLIESM